MSREKINVGFLGYGTRALDFLMESPYFHVRYFFAPESRMCQDVLDAKEKYGNELTYAVVKNNKDLAERLREIEDVDCFVMNACPIILKKEVLDEMDVYNIHPGSLEHNRGHHPHLWSILLDEPETEITIHKVCEEIDLGEVIKTVTVPVDEKDDAGTLLDKTEDQIPLLLEALKKYLCKEAEAEGIVTGGEYRPPLQYKDYEVDVENDSLLDIERKIRARAMHHGAFFRIGKERVYVDRVLHAEEQAEHINVELRVEQDKLFYAKGKDKVMFHISKRETAETGQQL